MRSAAEVGDLVRRAIGEERKPFKPHFSYDDKTDDLTVLVRDCSYVEVPSRENNLLVLLKDNYAGNRCVGFIVRCAGAYCSGRSLRRNGKVSIPELLRELYTAYPKSRDDCSTALRVAERNQLFWVVL